ncbi:hypothetical protein [Peribacillus sp. NPDC096448]|uniref:hypothetical protein n=1 Tax=Peribacillus sp. NPDC096448 TaxID=3364395 RepID=UPI0038010E97
MKKKMILDVDTWGFADDFFRPEVYEPFEKKHNVGFGKKIKSKGVEVYAGKKSRIGPVYSPGVPFFTRAFAYHIRYVI